MRNYERFYRISGQFLWLLFAMFVSAPELQARVSSQDKGLNNLTVEVVCPDEEKEGFSVNGFQKRVPVHYQFAKHRVEQIYQVASANIADLRKYSKNQMERREKLCETAKRFRDSVDSNFKALHQAEVDCTVLEKMKDAVVSGKIKALKFAEMMNKNYEASLEDFQPVRENARSRLKGLAAMRSPDAAIAGKDLTKEYSSKVLEEKKGAFAYDLTKPIAQSAIAAEKIAAEFQKMEVKLSASNCSSQDLNGLGRPKFTR